MKLSWKLFFITTPLFVLFLTVFGSWMIQDSFKSSLDKEIERCMMENQMFQNSYELTMHSLSDEQKEQASVQQIVESFHRHQGQNKGNVRIYNENGEILYQDSEFQVQSSILEGLDEENNVGYEIVLWNDEPYVVVQSRSPLGVFVEITRSVAEIFEARSVMYSRYQMGGLLVTVLVGGLMLIVLFFVMRNMQKLSRATRQFARGRYDVRVSIKSTDEIGMLASDFNWMANAMNLQMERLQNEVHRQEEFTAAFAHELKTPLTSIIGYADTIRQMELSKEETDMCADYIYRQGKRLQSLSYKLLDMTMAGKQEITYREIYVPEFLQEIEKTVQPALAEKNLTLHVQAQDGVIYGDRDLLASLFINLIDNARKASEPGKSIWITGQGIPGGCSIVVKDEGRGIPPEEISRITEAFYMVDKSRSRKEGGAGLGLALCQKIVELHQGSWQFESEPGIGLKVTVLFGLPEATHRQRTRRRRKAAPKETAGRSRRKNAEQ